MPPTILTEIKQSKPFEQFQQEVLVNLRRTAAVLTRQLENEFKPVGLTVTQFNVLRIVRGAGAPGIVQADIAERLVADTPDVPRLVKRLEDASLVVRRSDPNDARVLIVTLSPKGRKTLKAIDKLLRSINHTFFANLSQAELKTLNELLTKAR